MFIFLQYKMAEYHNIHINHALTAGRLSHINAMKNIRKNDIVSILIFFGKNLKNTLRNIIIIVILYQLTAIMWDNQELLKSFFNSLL